MNIILFKIMRKGSYVILLSFLFAFPCMQMSAT